MFKHWFISVRVKKSNLVPFYEKGDKIFFEKLSSGFTFYQYVAKYLTNQYSVKYSN